MSAHKDKKHHHEADCEEQKTANCTSEEGTSENNKQEEAPKEAVRQPKSVTITDIELENLKKELADFKDKYLRSLAEAENARKRLQKEKQEMIQYAQQSVIVDFLSPLDHMENALKFANQMSEDVKHWAVGFQMILTQFKDALTNNGVKTFISEGQQFDHHKHEAIESIVTDEFSPGTIVEESLKGYQIGDKIIRPARVKVAKAPLVADVKDKSDNCDNQTCEHEK